MTQLIQFLAFLFLTIQLFAQETNEVTVTFELKGVIMDLDASHLEKAKITVRQEGKLVEKVKTDASGKYQLTAELSSLAPFKIFYTKRGFVTKYILVDPANFPGGEMPVPNFDIDLFKGGKEFKFLKDEHVARFWWDPDHEWLDFDQAQSQEIKDRIHKLRAN